MKKANEQIPVGKKKRGRVFLIHSTKHSVLVIQFLKSKTKWTMSDIFELLFVSLNLILLMQLKKDYKDFKYLK